MIFLTWFRGFWNWFSNLVRLETWMALYPGVKIIDSHGMMRQTEVHKISALDTCNQTLIRSMVQGDILEHFVKLKNRMKLAGFC